MLYRTAFRKICTFFWNNNWLEVACQYSSVPPAWATITVFLITEFGDVLAKHITGLLSYLINVYWTVFLEPDSILVVPSSHPKHIKPEVDKYYVETTGQSKVSSRSLIKKSYGDYG
jgi:hypothetical protein